MEKAIAKDPNFWEAHMFAAEMNELIYNYEDAIYNYQKGLAINPQLNSTGSTYFYLSNLQKVTGDFPTFNSTAPVKIGDEWLVFYHFKFMGRIPDQERPILFYGLSCYTLDAKLTKIVRHLPEVMFEGSLEDELITWTDVQGNPVSKQPACVLPFGATVNDDTLALSLGVNDSFMGIFRMRINDLLSLMETV